MTAWADNQRDFSGRYDVNTTLMAMAGLVHSGDARLDAVLVKGDRVVTEAEAQTIRTRSRARTMHETYAQVPVLVRMFRLLVDELLSRADAAAEESWEDGDDDDDHSDVDGEGSWVDTPGPGPGAGAGAGSGHKGRSPFAPAEDYAYLSELVEAGVALDGDDDDDAFEDPEIKADPVYKADMADYLREFVRTLHRDAPARFAALYATLPPDTQEALRSHVQ
jgi:hypothetical protein